MFLTTPWSNCWWAFPCRNLQKQYLEQPSKMQHHTLVTWRRIRTYFNWGSLNIYKQWQYICSQKWTIVCFPLQYWRIPPTCYLSFIYTKTVRLPLTAHLYLLLTFLIFFLILKFLKEITHTVCDKTIEQPTTQTIRDDILMSQGPVVTYHSFKHGKRRSRAIAETEYYKTAESFWYTSWIPSSQRVRLTGKYLWKANLTLGQTVPMSAFRNLTMPSLNPCTTTSLLLWGNTFEVIITSQNGNILCGSSV